MGEIDSLDEQPLTNEELELRKSWKDILSRNGYLEYFEDITKLSSEEFENRVNKVMKQMEEKAKAEQEAKEKAEQEAKAKAEQEAKEKAEQEAKAKAEQEAKAKAEQEAKAKAEQEDNLRVEPEQEDDNRSDDAMKIASALKRGITPDEYKKMAEVLTQKEHQELYTEKYRTGEESIRDEVGDELNRAEQNNNINNTQSVDLWMNRFNNWYNVIDRMSKRTKAKFVKMKDDIVKAIKSITRDRSQSYEMEEHNDEQSER